MLKDDVINKLGVTCDMLWSILNSHCDSSVTIGEAGLLSNQVTKQLNSVGNLMRTLATEKEK